MEEVFCDFDLLCNERKTQAAIRKEICRKNECPADVNEETPPYTEYLIELPEEFDVLKGFEVNCKYITKAIYEYFLDHFDISYETISSTLENTQVKEHYVLETAFYLRELMNSTYIFDSMELTPIIVNLCKAGESLEADLLEKLNKKYDFNREGILIGKNKDSFDIEGKWKTERGYGIGEFQGVIKHFTNKYEKKYQKALIDKFDVDDVEHTFRFINHHCVYFCNCKKGFEDCMDNWRKSVRNGNLHRHDTFSLTKVEEVFERTLELVGLLIEWYNIMSKA